MRIFELLGRDWFRAPLSGTIMVVLFVLGCLTIAKGERDHGLLLLILAQTVSNGRGKMK